MLVALVGLVLACRNEPPTEASIRIRLDTDSIGSGCTSSLCSAYPMSCGALVSLRVVDPATGEVLLRDGVEELSKCQQAPSGEDLCGVADLEDMQIFGIPPQNVRIEVAIYNPDNALGGVSDSCPRPRFDAFGHPVSVLSEPTPAFAGAAYFQAGHAEGVTVPLFCSNASLLSEDSCAANQPTDVRAVVTDIESMQTIRKEQAPSIAVSVGEARSITDNTGVTSYVLETVDTSPLLLNNTGAIPAYESDSIETRFGALVCSTTLDGQPQATIAVRCEDVIAGSPKLEVQPMLIRKTIVDAALLALGETSFPETGLVIGRVVDERFSPAAGVAVTPAAGGSVLYLDEQLDGSAIGLTSTSAYFVATDVPFGSEWIASHFDGRRQSGTPRGGLIHGKVSGVLIRMTGDVIGD